MFGFGVFILNKLHSVKILHNDSLNHVHTLLGSCRWKKYYFVYNWLVQKLFQLHLVHLLPCSGLGLAFPLPFSWHSEIWNAAFWAVTCLRVRVLLMELRQRVIVFQKLTRCKQLCRARGTKPTALNNAFSFLLREWSLNPLLASETDPSAVCSLLTRFLPICCWCWRAAQTSTVHFIRKETGIAGKCIYTLSICVLLRDGRGLSWKTTPRPRARGADVCSLTGLEAETPPERPQQVTGSATTLQFIDKTGDKLCQSALRSSGSWWYVHHRSCTSVRWGSACRMRCSGHHPANQCGSVTVDTGC